MRTDWRPFLLLLVLLFLCAEEASPCYETLRRLEADFASLFDRPAR